MKFLETELWFEDEPYPILVNPKHIVLAEPNWVADAPQGTTKLTLVGGRLLLIAMPFAEFAMWLRHYGNPMPLPRPEDC